MEGFAMEDDYGFGEIRGAYDAVIVDCNAIELSRSDMPAESYRNARQILGRFKIHNMDANIHYSSLVLDMFRGSGNFVVTEKLAKEYRHFRPPFSGRHHAEKASRYGRILKSIRTFAPTERVLSLTKEETTACEKMRDFFWYETVHISETDFDMLATGLALASCRGDTAVLSNDVGLNQVHKRMAERVNSPDFLAAGIGAVANVFACYSMIGRSRFYLSSVFAPALK